MNAQVGVHGQVNEQKVDQQRAKVAIPAGDQRQGFSVKRGEPEKNFQVQFSFGSKRLKKKTICLLQSSEDHQREGEDDNGEGDVDHGEANQHVVAYQRV